MKKASVFLLFLLFLFPLFAQSTDVDVGFDTDIEEIDDFDSIFADAEDVEEAIVQEGPSAETPVQVVSSAFSSMVHFSGKFTGEVGALYAHRKEVNEAGEEDNDDASGFFTLKNILNMSIIPSSIFSVRGSLETSVDNHFTMDVSSLYFNYLLLNHVYISAGKKSISWGNIRLFTTDYFGCEKHSTCLYSIGPRYANIFVEDGVPLALDVRYPWSNGTLTFAVTGNKGESVKPNNFNYYGSLEFSVLNTNFNLYVKRPAKNTNPVRTDLAGLEVKRTIAGFDVYAQGLVRVKDYNNLNNPDGYDYILATAGLYRLFESFDPNIGFNLEYQHEYNPSSQEVHYDRLAFEGGLKRMGKNKNMKIGVISHYNITEKHGFSALNFIVSGVLPYADWSNKVGVGYGSKYEIPAFLISSSIALALDY